MVFLNLWFKIVQFPVKVFNDEKPNHFMIQNIIIMRDNGIPLFGRSLMCNIGMKCIDLSKDSTFKDETILHSALFSAMLVYDQATPLNFHEFEFQQSKIISFPKEKIAAVLSVEPSDDSDLYKNRLRLITELFEKEYSNAIDDLNITVDTFTDFEKTLANEGLLEEDERFRSNCINCEWDKACPFRIVAKSPSMTIKERLDAIKPLKFPKMMLLIIKGMFKPKYLN